jgi:hypothetical protein
MAMAQHTHGADERAAGTSEPAADAARDSTSGTGNGMDESGAHALATGTGSAGGAAIGAALGSIVGPAGAAAGATMGAVVGGLAGRTASEGVNGSEEDSYWRENYITRPYADDTLSYDYYRPAYRYGWESRARNEGRRWDELERELERGWRENRGTSRLGWGDAKLAARDAWQRVDRRMADERQDTRDRETAADTDAATGSGTA